jgi:formylmethanofuran dehydrogenase subunit B
MSGPRAHSDVVCLACGTLCDDLVVTIDANRVTNLAPPCDAAQRWLERVARPEDTPSATLDGTPASLDAALDQAATLLACARAPLMTGLAAASIETQRVAVALADHVGAAIDAGTPESRARLAAIARVGRCSAMLGEVRARADLVLFWACDPIATHPRLLEKHIRPPGRFAPSHRPVVVVDVAPNATSAHADASIALRPEHRIAALAVLRALQRGASLDAARLVATTGHPLDTWATLADRLRAARYGVVFTGAKLDDPAEHEALLLLVRDLNQRPDGRFVHLTLGAPGNAAGAEAVLGWQAGYAPSVSFAAHHPTRLDDAPTLDRHDLLIELADSETRHDESPHGIPTIRISPAATSSHPTPAVAIATAALGARDVGTVMRADGVSLPLTRLLPTLRPDAAHVLRAILARIEPATTGPETRIR